MKDQQLSKIISEVAEQENLTEKAIEIELINYLDQKYLDAKSLEQKLTENAKLKILLFLYSAQSQKIGNGYCGWHVPSYKGLLYQFVGFDAAEKMYFDTVCDQLLDEDLIYNKAYVDDKEPTEVGLTKKGIIYVATMKNK